MSLSHFISFLSIISFHSFFTDCIELNGFLKSSKKIAVAGEQKILVYQGENLLCESRTNRKGAFSLNFCTGSGLGQTVDFYSLGREKDTIMIGSISGFQSDGALHGNFFLPDKVNNNSKSCPGCHKTDKIYSLVYFSKEQKEFERDIASLYCSRDKRKF